jgi:hypothetical protein
MKQIFVALLAVSVCSMPALEAIQHREAWVDIAVRIASAGAVVGGLKILKGSSSSTKLKKITRCSLGCILLAGGVLGMVGGQQAYGAQGPSPEIMEEFFDDISTGVGMVKAAIYRVYYNLMRRYTGKLQDHGWYYYYHGKHAINKQLISHKLQR